MHHRQHHPTHASPINRSTWDDKQQEMTAIPDPSVTSVHPSAARLSKAAFLDVYTAYGYREITQDNGGSAAPCAFNIEKQAEPGKFQESARTTLCRDVEPNPGSSLCSKPTPEKLIVGALEHARQDSATPTPCSDAEIVPVDTLRRQEFPALYHPRENPQGAIYLDHAGATLYAQSQIARCHSHLQESIFGNPHSKGPVASATADLVEEARSSVLAHFHAPPEDWTVVFTSGATAALKMAAELFPWRGRGASRLIYAHNAHTSVLGMREIALEAGAGFACLPPSVQYGEKADVALAAALHETMHQTGSSSPSPRHENGVSTEDASTVTFSETEHLLVLPAECNFSGRKLDWARLRQALARLRTTEPGQRVSVLLDAAKYVGTSPLDLGSFQEGEVDMLSLSFYKLFGYPTGLGCLLVRSSLARRWLSETRGSSAAPHIPLNTHSRHVRRRYFGGGTVLAAVPETDYRLLRPEPARRFADGTEDFLGIISLREGFRFLDEVLGGIERVRAHTWALTRFCYEQLSSLRHANGQHVCVMYSLPSASPARQGPVVTFNVRRADGSIAGYSEVEKLATLHGIQLRTGCFCNPGACQEALGLSVEDVQAQLNAGHVCWDDNDLIEGRPTGAVRVSFGYMSTWEDVTAFLHVIDKYFVSKTAMAEAADASTPPFHALSFDKREPLGSPSTLSLRLGSIFLYPIKSCAAMSVEAWPVGPTGLLFDREWALVDGHGQALRLNKVAQMRFIRPRVDLERQELVVAAPGMPDLALSVRLVPTPDHVRDVSVCGQACQGLGYQGAAGIDAWFTRFLKRSCSLVRACPYSPKRRSRTVVETHRTDPVATTTGDRAERKEINFTNEAQFLLISSASVAHLNDLIAQQVDLDYALCYEGVRSDRCYVTLENFRPNLVIDGGVAHQEDLWKSVDVLPGDRDEGGDQGREVGLEMGVRLKVTGPCARCSMVNIDHRCDLSASKKKCSGPAMTSDDEKVLPAQVAPVLKMLASYRREKANIYFGQFLAFDDLVGRGFQGWLRTGAVVQAQRRSGEGAT